MTYASLAIRLALAVTLLLSGMAVGYAQANRQRAPAAPPGPPAEYPRVELDQFFADAAKFHEHKVTTRGHVSQSGSYYALTSPTNARDKRYAKLTLTNEQREWVRKNCQVTCIIDVEALAKKGPPFGILEVRSIARVPVE